MANVFIANCPGNQIEFCQLCWGKHVARFVQVLCESRSKIHGAHVITDSGLMNRVFELNQYRGKPFRPSTWRSQRAISELAIVDRVKFEV